MAKEYSIVCIYSIFFIHSSVDGHLGCFQVLAIVYSATVNIGVHVSFWVMVFSGQMSRSGISGSYGNSIFRVFFFSFLGPYLQHMELPRLGSNQSFRCQPIPQPQPPPQQCQIQAASMTYTTAYGNTGSSTHWARPGIKPTSSLMLVGFVSAQPQQELLKYLFSPQWHESRNQP